jgi:hypothetical protein
VGAGAAGRAAGRSSAGIIPLDSPACKALVNTANLFLSVGKVAAAERCARVALSVAVVVQQSHHRQQRQQSSAAGDEDDELEIRRSEPPTPNVSLALVALARCLQRRGALEAAALCFRVEFEVGVVVGRGAQGSLGMLTVVVAPVAAAVGVFCGGGAGARAGGAVCWRWSTRFGWLPSPGCRWTCASMAGLCLTRQLRLNAASAAAPAAAPGAAC